MLLDTVRTPMAQTIYTLHLIITQSTLSTKYPFRMGPTITSNTLPCLEHYIAIRDILHIYILYLNMKTFLIYLPWKMLFLISLLRMKCNWCALVILHYPPLFTLVWYMMHDLMHGELTGFIIIIIITRFSWQLPSTNCFLVNMTLSISYYSYQNSNRNLGWNSLEWKHKKIYIFCSCRCNRR